VALRWDDLQYACTTRRRRRRRLIVQALVVCDLKATLPAPINDPSKLGASLLVRRIQSLMPMFQLLVTLKTCSDYILGRQKPGSGPVVTISHAAGADH
jgi:hypothetical protein